MKEGEFKNDDDEVDCINAIPNQDFCLLWQEQFWKTHLHSLWEMQFATFSFYVDEIRNYNLVDFIIWQDCRREEFMHLALCLPENDIHSSAFNASGTKILLIQATSNQTILARKRFFILMLLE